MGKEIIAELSLTYLDCKKEVIFPHRPFNAIRFLPDNRSNRTQSNLAQANRFFVGEIQNATLGKVAKKALKELSDGKHAKTIRVEASLPAAFVLKFKDKMLSKEANSPRARQNRVFLESQQPLIDRGFHYEVIVQHKTAQGESIRVQEPIKIITTIEDLSSGDKRALIPFFNKPNGSDIHHHRTQNCNLAGENGVFNKLEQLLNLSEYKFGAAVGYVSTIKEDYLIIARDISEVNRIRQTYEVSMHQVTWYLTKSVMDLVERILLITQEIFPEIKYRQDGSNSLIPVPINVTDSHLLNNEIDYSSHNCNIM